MKLQRQCIGSESVFIRWYSLCVPFRYAKEDPKTLYAHFQYLNAMFSRLMNLLLPETDKMNMGVQKGEVQLP